MKSLKILSQLVLFSCLVFTMASCGQKNNRSDDIHVDSTQGNAKPGVNKQNQTKRPSVEIDVNQKEPFGKFLTDNHGRSVYLFLKDSGAKSTCYDECAEAWPPVLTNGKKIPSGQGVDSTMLSVINRKDGSLQIAYGGHPLYYYEDDTDAGDVEGQDKKEYGAEWYLVKPNGKKMGDVEEEEEQ